MLSYSTKMEVNLFNSKSVATDMQQLSNFIIKNRIPVVVTEPDFVENVILDRNKFSPAYKIICAVDFSTGKHYALEKIRDLPRNALLADGFEFRVTHGKSDKESLNELRALTEFIKKTIDPTKEIRWALGLRTVTRDNYDKTIQHMKQWPASFIRTDINLDSPSATVDAHKDDIGFIRERVALPIKISGNIDYDTMLTLMGRAARFDVTVSQAKRILKDALEMDRIQKDVVYVDEAPEGEQKE